MAAISCAFFMSLVEAGVHDHSPVVVRNPAPRSTTTLGMNQQPAYRSRCFLFSPGNSSLSHHVQFAISIQADSMWIMARGFRPSLCVPRAPTSKRGRRDTKRLFAAAGPSLSLSLSHHPGLSLRSVVFLRQQGMGTASRKQVRQQKHGPFTPGNHLNISSDLSSIQDRCRRLLVSLCNVVAKYWPFYRTRTMPRTFLPLIASPSYPSRPQFKDPLRPQLLAIHP